MDTSLASSMTQIWSKGGIDMSWLEIVQRDVSFRLLYNLSSQVSSKQISINSSRNVLMVGSQQRSNGNILARR